MNFGKTQKSSDKIPGDCGCIGKPPCHRDLREYWAATNPSHIHDYACREDRWNPRLRCKSPFPVGWDNCQTTAFRKSYVTAVFRYDVFGWETFNATIKEREEADLLNQLHHACCWVYFWKIHVHLFLSFVLKHFNHILVATHKLAASVQHSGVRETAFVTYMF